MRRPQVRPRLAPPVGVPLALACLLLAYAIPTAEGRRVGGRIGGGGSSSAGRGGGVPSSSSGGGSDGDGDSDPATTGIVIASIVAIMALCLGLYCYVKRRGCPRWCLSLWHRLLGCIFPSQFQRNKSLLPEVASPKQEVSSVPLPTKGGGRTAVTNEGLDSVAGLIKMRLHLSNGTPQLGGGSPVALPPSGRYFGQYEECGKMKEVTYNLEFLKDGSMSGRCEDDDGELQVRGAFDTKAEVYRWGETMKGAKYTKLENLPSQYESEVVSGKQFHVEVIMRYEGKLTAELVGEYFSSTGAQGPLSITKA